MIYLIPFIAFWFANITGIPQRRPITNRKPFTCSKCMGAWLALIYQYYLGFTIESLFIIPLSSLGAYLIECLAEKLKLPLHK